MLELIPASKHATSDEYFGQYCIRFILGIGKVFFQSTMKTKEEKKDASGHCMRSPLSHSQTLRRDTYTNSRKLQTISMFHHTRALSNNSPCNINVIYPPGWTQSHHSRYPLHPSENCPFSRPYISIPFGNGLEE